MGSRLFIFVRVCDKGGMIMKAISKKTVEESLIEQLEIKGKCTKYYLDLVADYLYYYDLKKDLRKDIKKKGVRYISINGNGKEVEKANESIVNLHKTTQIMLKILQDLGLQDPIRGDETAGYV